MRAAWVDPTPTVLIFSSIYGGGDASPGFRQGGKRASNRQVNAGSAARRSTQAGLCNHNTIRVGRSFSFVPGSTA